MKISQDGINLIKRFEGCKLTAYRDSVGVWTIGYGHTKNVKRGDVISEYQAELFLKQDLTNVERELNKISSLLTQRKYDALCSWVFNLGIGNFNSSTMKKYIMARRSDIDITDQLIRWHNAGGKPLLGLKRRRVAEANMWHGRDVYYVDTQGVIKKIMDKAKTK